MSMTVRKIAEALEELAPLPLQEEYDNAGLQVGLPGAEVSGVLLCLDVTEATVEEAIRLGCELIVSHHPLIFKPLRRVTGATYQERCVALALRHGISVYSAHTNLDNAGEGVNYRIASVIGLQDLDWLEEKPVADSTLHTTLVFCVCYIGVLLIGTLLLSLDGYDFVTNFTGTLACISNIGPGLSLVGPAGNYSMFSAFNKLILTFAMLLGRLEIFPLLLLFSPSVWRKQ